MHSRAVELLAASLRKGELFDAPPWDVAAAVELLAGALARPGDITPGEVRAAARILNKRRHFDSARTLAQAWLDCRGFDATIARHQVQAHIELGALDTAEALLREGLARIGAAGAGAQDKAEIPEYEGLLGRVFKQRFVATGDKDALTAATDQYLRAQRSSPPALACWPGINAIALRAREAREGVTRDDVAPAETLAATLREQVLDLQRRNPGDPWLASTLYEANLALDDCDNAELWLYRFLHHPKVQPFDVASCARQLREVWQGSDAAGPGGTCADRLAAIVTRHVARTQSAWTVAAADVRATAHEIDADRSGYEKNFSGESSFGVDMIRRMLATCASIGCVCTRIGERLGTGFLVAGNALAPPLGPAPLFLTNAHVIGGSVAGSIPPQDARVTFEVESAEKGAPVFYEVAEVLFTSDPCALGARNAAGDALDVTIVRLAGLPQALAGLKVAAGLPLVEPKAKAYVVGHPRGSGLQISLHDSLLLDIDDDERLLHYRTPTDPGSSGSPVFNARFEVIAIHHGGSSTVPRLHGRGEYEANEGIALAAVARRMAR